MTDGWPKEWSEVRGKSNNEDGGVLYIDTNWMEYQQGLRGYQGTLYACIDLGRDTDENRDLWMPFEQYVLYCIKEGLDNEF